MKGFVDFHLYNKKIDYKLTFKRKLTIIQGDSATRKSLLIKFLDDALNKLTTHISCKYECRILTNFNWKRELEEDKDILYFSDEEHSFYYTKEFAKRFEKSRGYFVLITRKDIETLPYSISSIYKFKNSGKFTTMENIYTFKDSLVNSDFSDIDTIICEDSRSGFEFYNIFCKGKFNVVSCNGKSNFEDFLQYSPPEKKFLLVVDGAAFGSNIKSIYEICNRKGYNLFSPESFEYILLHLKTFKLENFLSNEEHIANEIGSDWISWERYFTALLIHRTKGSEFEYRKTQLNTLYTNEGIYSQLAEHFQVIDKLYNVNKTITETNYFLKDSSVKG